MEIGDRRRKAACSGRRFEISATNFYTYQLLLDLKVEKGMAIRTEPHPRFYTDRTDTVPIAVPALVRNWWPMVFFTVFKAPAEGRTHIFRPNEPFAQIIVIPEEANFELEPMGEEEAAERELQARRIYANRPNLSAGTEWTSSTDTVFDGTYRHLHRAAKEKRARMNSRMHGIKKTGSAKGPVFDHRRTDQLR